MKRSWIYRVVVLVVLLVVVIFAAKKQTIAPISPVEQTGAAEVYYLDAQSQQLVFESYEVVGNSKEEQMENILLQMAKKPQTEGLVSTMPETVTVLGVSLEETLARVDLSAGYEELTPGQKMYLRGALVWTLTSLPFVEQVELSVEGVPLVHSNQEPLGPMDRYNLVINQPIDPEPTNALRILTLYFADAEGKTLVKEERTVEVNANQALERYVLEELIVGPEEEGHTQTVPKGTTVRDIKTADGICYVDLSQDFVTGHTGGTVEEYLTIYSIVNSLCELDGIKKVQFLIEGEKQENFKGNSEFGQPFSPILLEE